MDRTGCQYLERQSMPLPSNKMSNTQNGHTMIPDIQESLWSNTLRSETPQSRMPSQASDENRHVRNRIYTSSNNHELQQRHTIVVKARQRRAPHHGNKVIIESRCTQVTQQCVTLYRLPMQKQTPLLFYISSI